MIKTLLLENMCLLCNLNRMNLQDLAAVGVSGSSRLLVFVITLGNFSDLSMCWVNLREDGCMAT